jgi:hypothetical protein
VDFLNGSSRIGAGTVRVMDKRLTASDQTTGQVTSRIKDAPGSRAVLERWVDDAAEWRKVIDGAVHGYTVDPDGLLNYDFALRDGREFERAQPMFFSNHVILGEGGKTGPEIDYGAQAGGGYMIDAVGPFESVSVGFLDHFERLSAADPEDGIYWGVAALGTYELGDVATRVGLGAFGYPVQDSDGVFRYRDIRIKWRAKGTADPWIELRAMPRAEYSPAITLSHIGAVGNIDGGNFQAFGTSSLYFGSTDSADIPTTGQELEFKVLAEFVTPDSPFWWDGGTLGDLLLEIVAGDHTEDPPRERYDTAAVAAFALSSKVARFNLREPVADRRKWVEENIYKASFTAPAFNLYQEIRPVSWKLPTVAELVGAPIIDADTIQPIGDFTHGTDNAVGAVEYTYIRESMAPRDLSALEELPSVAQRIFAGLIVELEPWRRLVETPVTVRTEDPDAPPGAQTLVYAPVTIRSIGSVDDADPTGDSLDELGNQLVAEAQATVFPRFRTGAPKYAVDITATPANLALYVGQWVLVRFAPLPNYETGQRGLSRWMQIYALADPAPHLRRLLVVDGGVTDDATGTVDPGGTDCFGLGGGVLYPTADGVIRVFHESGFLTNDCDVPITLPALIVGGGGGGGGGDAGGGGGAGQVKGSVGEEVEVLIQPGQSVFIEIGEGGAQDTGGDPSTVWSDDAGLALDPLTDPAPAARRAVGGGEGGAGGEVGGGGGSGGGGGGDLPISGGGTDVGGFATDPDLGHDGGDGSGSGGIATCQRAAGGGGGSFLAAGEDAVIGVPSRGGRGGAEFKLTDWGVVVGSGGGGAAAHSAGELGEECGDDFDFPGRPGTGFGAGGGGAALGVGASAGRPGVVMFRYSGPVVGLQSPEISSTETDSQNRSTICVEGSEWPPAPDGFRVRVDYATGATEPDASSGLWRLAGYLDAPGCVTTPPLPTGSTVWSRAVAEAPGYLPSGPGTAVDEATPGTPGLLKRQLTVSSDGVATVTWTANAYSAAVRIRGKVHAAGEDTARPLTLLDDLAASVGVYVLADVVAQGEYATVDIEAWEDGTYVTQGSIYRLSAENPVRSVVTPTDNWDSLADVTYPTPPADREMAVYDEYDGQWKNELVRLDDMPEPEDNTDLDSDATRHGLLPKLSGSTSEFLRGDGSWAEPPGDPWTNLIAGSDQDVTNNATLQNDSELSFAVTAGIYEVELFLIYSGSDSTVDFQYGFTFPASKFTYWAQGSENVAGTGPITIAVTATLRNATNLGSTMNRGTPTGSHLQCVERFWGMMIVTASGTVQFQFANVTAAVGAVSRRHAGTILRYRRYTP